MMSAASLVHRRGVSIPPGEAGAVGTANMREFLTPEGFRGLSQDLPSLALFERHDAIQRAYGQRSHNRYYLAYETSIYHRNERAASGVLKHELLPAAWRQFIEEMDTSKVYRDFIKEVFHVRGFRVRYAWHAGITGSEVSPYEVRLTLTPPKGSGHILCISTRVRSGTRSGAAGL